MDELLDFINREIPSHSEKLYLAIEEVVSVFECAKGDIDESISNLISEKNDNKANKYRYQSKRLAEYIEVINRSKDKLTLDPPKSNNATPKETLKMDKKLMKNNKNDSQLMRINYDDYKVNEDIEYYLNTDFTHKRPAAFMLENIKHPANQWKKVLIQTCELLFQKNVFTFNTFLKDRSMQGKRRLYFSTVAKEMTRPERVCGSKIFVETNLSANQIRDIIINMLDQYGISIDSYKIYLSKDLTSIAREKNKNSSKSSLYEKSSNTTEKVDKRVKPKSRIYGLQDDYRFLKDTYIKRVEPHMKYLNGNIGSPSHLEFLKMDEGDHRRHKSRCLYNDKTMGKCMCDKSPYSMMKCGGSARCIHYKEQME